MAYLRLLLNDIYVDLGFLHDHDDPIQLSFFKERVSNLKKANDEYQIAFIKEDVEKVISKIQNFNYSSTNKQETKKTRELIPSLMNKLSDGNQNN